MSGADDIEHVDVMFPDEVIEVGVDENEAGTRSPMT